MFETFIRTLRVRGGADGSLVWGYHTAARFTSWHVQSRSDGSLWLAAQCQEIDRFMCKQTPIVFAVPRRGGHWVFPVLALTVDGAMVTAKLGPIEQ